MHVLKEKYYRVVADTTGSGVLLYILQRNNPPAPTATSSSYIFRTKLERSIIKELRLRGVHHTITLCLCLHERKIRTQYNIEIVIVA